MLAHGTDSLLQELYEPRPSFVAKFDLARSPAFVVVRNLSSVEITAFRH
jgi:hypothetical protein